jgi:hypothetical protein
LRNSFIISSGAVSCAASANAEIIPVIETRWSEGHNEGPPELAADLLRARVDVIATPISTAATLAAEAAIKTIPIVFVVGAPLQFGFIASLNRPGGSAPDGFPRNGYDQRSPNSCLTSFRWNFLRIRHPPGGSQEGGVSFFDLK